MVKSIIRIVGVISGFLFENAGFGLIHFPGIKYVPEGDSNFSENCSDISDKLKNVYLMTI